MNSFSTKIYNEIIAILPQLEGQNLTNNDFLEFTLENDNYSSLGNITIQTDSEDIIWIKADYPFTTYAVDSTEELIYIIGGILSNNMFWVVSYKDDEWEDTFFTIKDYKIETESGFVYKILSWDGKNDQLIKA